VIAYKPNWFHGNHEFKAGFDYVASSEIAGTNAKQVNYMLLYNDGVPFEVSFFNSPIHPKVASNYFGLYLKDSWTVGRRLTLNLGLRYGHEASGTPETCREQATGPSAPIFPAGCFAAVRLPTWNFVVPRLYASYDLSGDGKTVVKGGWGRFGNTRGIADITRYDPNAIAYAVFHWRDLNGNSDWNEGESNRDPNGPDFIETVAHEFGAAPPRFVPNPDETQVMFDEYSVNLERELMANFSIRVTGIYSKTNNVKGNLNPYRPYEAYNIPVTNRDPGPDGTRGTADDGGLVTYYEYSPSLQSREFEAYTPITYPGRAADQTYKTIEVASVKRLANRWQLVASYSATKKHRPIGAIGLASSSGFGTASPTFSPDGTEALYVTPNNEINSTDNTWEWDGKVSGTYIFPAEVLVSASFHHESGDPFARQVNFRGGVTIPSIVLSVDPIGSYRRPHLNVTTLKVEKRFLLPRAQSTTVTFSLYNLLNSNTATGLQNRSGPEFLRPRAIMPPRLGEFSVSYRF
jgi:hypothetical protein